LYTSVKLRKCNTVIWEIGTHVVLEHAVFNRRFVRGWYVNVFTLGRRKSKMQTPLFWNNQSQKSIILSIRYCRCNISHSRHRHCYLVARSVDTSTPTYSTTLIIICIMSLCICMHHKLCTCYCYCCCCYCCCCRCNTTGNFGRKQLPVGRRFLHCQPGVCCFVKRLKYYTPTWIIITNVNFTCTEWIKLIIVQTVRVTAIPGTHRDRKSRERVGIRGYRTVGKLLERIIFYTYTII